MTGLFGGKESLRVRGEHTTLIATLCSLPATIVVLGWLFQHQITWQELALVLVLAMIYVAFARRRLLGGGVRIHARQLPHVHAVVEECARMLRMPAPHVFVRAFVVGWLSLFRRVQPYEKWSRTRLVSGSAALR